jgi:hypothetical protein
MKKPLSSMKKQSQGAINAKFLKKLTFWRAPRHFVHPE